MQGFLYVDITFGLVIICHYIREVCNLRIVLGNVIVEAQSMYSQHK